MMKNQDRLSILSKIRDCFTPGAMTIPTDTNAFNNLSLRGVERRSNPKKNEIAAPFRLAMTCKRKKCLAVRFIILWTSFFLSVAIGQAETVKNIAAEGSCAIVGMSAEESQLIALQRARAAAIEQAVGVSVVSGTLVTNMILRADFIKTYSKGLIIREKVEWLPLRQYQKDSSTPPIPEYRVRLTADVYVPQVKIKPIGLQAIANSAVFKNGDRATVEMGTGREARVAIFNITADDRVVMLFPNEYEKNSHLSKNQRLVFPEKNSKVELIMQTLPGHKRDAEAFYIVAMDESGPKKFMDLFTPGRPMNFSTFFKKYSEISDYCEDAILTYEVMDGKDCDCFIPPKAGFAMTIPANTNALNNLSLRGVHLRRTTRLSHEIASLRSQ